MCEKQARSDLPRDTDEENQDIFETEVCMGHRNTAEWAIWATESTRSPTWTTTKIAFRPYITHHMYPMTYNFRH